MTQASALAGALTPVIRLISMAILGNVLASHVPPAAQPAPDEARNAGHSAAARPTPMNALIRNEPAAAAVALLTLAEDLPVKQPTKGRARFTASIIAGMTARLIRGWSGVHSSR